MIRPRLHASENDSMATTLEDEPRELAEKVLSKGGWTGGKHV